MQLRIRYYDQATHTSHEIELPEGAHCVTVLIPEQPWYAPMAGISLPPLEVSVNTDAVEVRANSETDGRRLMLHEFSDLIQVAEGE